MSEKEELAVDPAEEVVIGVSIDPEAEKAFRELITPTGFTLEQIAQMFFCWCAHYPEEAMTWLKNAAREQASAEEDIGKAEN